MESISFRQMMQIESGYKLVSRVLYFVKILKSLRNNPQKYSFYKKQVFFKIKKTEYV